MGCLRFHVITSEGDWTIFKLMTNVWKNVGRGFFPLTPSPMFLCSHTSSVVMNVLCCTFSRILSAKGLHNFVSKSSDGLHCQRKTTKIRQAGAYKDCRNTWSYITCCVCRSQVSIEHSHVGRIFRITTRSATLCPVVMVPFL